MLKLLYEDVEKGFEVEALHMLVTESRDEVAQEEDEYIEVLESEKLET